MELLKVVINSTADAKAGKGILEGVLPEQIKEIKDLTIGILENGTVKGQPVIMFALRDENGQVQTAQITGNHFLSLVEIYRGALHRFELENALNN